ncbi:glycosyltransferase [Winogradskyella pacifica]|uniref:glycosyltransferase n=1 Tax=Winogradskyella pacifica TaxID=664642 RepID=UPI0015CA4F32|nr:glycosyltransferase [Winogradskyella pacifica]
MSKKIKVFFILPTLFAGGAERVMSFVSQNLNKEKFDVTLIVIGFEKESKYEVKDITVTYLSKKRVLNSALILTKIIYKQHPQIVLSSISHLNIMMGLISKFFPKVKFIGRHATISNVAIKYKTAKRKFNISSLLKLDSIGIKNLNYIICQSSDMKNDFLDIYDIDANNVKIIHNPVTQIDIVKERNQNKEIKKFITIGRLSKIKGQLRLLDVLSRLTVPFHFTIIGTGSYSEVIHNKIKELGLSENITHIEYTDNVFLHLINHDMFLQGSYSEGFPNALLESCSVGVPVIAFNSPGGTKEIVSNGINGYLVNNEDEFLEKLYEDKDWDPKSIREFVYEKFNKEKIIKQYETLFFDILTQN